MNRSHVRQILVAFLGAAVTAIPDLASVRGMAADTLHTLGPTIASVGLMAVFQSLRVLRWVNVVLGAASVVAVFIFDFEPTAAIGAIAAGSAIVGLSATDRPDPDFRGRWWALVSGSRGRR